MAFSLEGITGTPFFTGRPCQAAGREYPFYNIKRGKEDGRLSPPPRPRLLGAGSRILRSARVWAKSTTTSSTSTCLRARSDAMSTSTLSTSMFDRVWDASARDVSAQAKRRDVDVDVDVDVSARAKRRDVDVDVVDVDVLANE